MGNPLLLLHSKEFGLLAPREALTTPFLHGLPLNTCTILTCLKLYIHPKSVKKSELKKWRESRILSLETRETIGNIYFEFHATQPPQREKWDSRLLQEERGKLGPYLGLLYI